MPGSHSSRRSKADALSENGTLNPAPEKVRDPKFQEGGFFDPRDVVQVKYEMLRRVSAEKASVTDVSGEYSVSRPTLYQARADFEEAGIAGLVPKKRGPRGPHKLQSEVVAFLKTRLIPGEPIRARELAKLVQNEFGLEVHPRTIERAIGGKKHRDDHGRPEAGDTLANRGGAVRVVARCHAGRCTASGRPLRPDRSSASRHVGVGAHDRSCSCPTNTDPGCHGPSAGSERDLRRAARGRPTTRRHGYDDH